MDIYGDFHSLDTFTHRGVKAEVLKALKGRRHCGTQHGFNDKQCSKCNAKIRAKMVYVIKLSDSLLNESFASIADAVEYAKLVIDDSRDNDPSHEDPPTPPNIPEDDSPEDEDPPKPPSAPPANTLRRKKMLLLIKQSGWGKKYAAIARRMT